MSAILRYRVSKPGAESGREDFFNTSLQGQTKMPTPNGPKLGTKLAEVNRLLRRPNGATLTPLFRRLARP
jgi:hypothetical protein